MPLTMVRINMLAGVGPVLQIAEGWSVEIPDEARETIERRTDPAWPTTFFAPRLTGKGAFTSAYDVMDNWGANHGAIGYGHFGADPLTLAACLNSCEHAQRRRGPSDRNWAFFGTDDAESADFRAR